MIATRKLLLALVLIASISAVLAQSPKSMLVHVGNSSFQIDVPTGWIADADAANRGGSVFVLIPAGINPKDTSTSISCRYYKDMVQTVAMYRSKRLTLRQDPAAQFVELPLRDAGDARTVVEELRSKRFPRMATAYIPLGSDVLWIEFKSRSDEAYKQGLSVFQEMLKSYKGNTAQN